jgi:hypothetical protein
MGQFLTDLRPFLSGLSVKKRYNWSIISLKNAAWWFKERFFYFGSLSQDKRTK